MQRSFSNSQMKWIYLPELQPTKNWKKPGIDGYRGIRFTEWDGIPSYYRLTLLSLSFCPNCWILPPLAQLHSLKNLAIYGMHMLETIRYEFYGKDGSFSETCFPEPLTHLSIILEILIMLSLVYTTKWVLEIIFWPINYSINFAMCAF